jgi:hypothetical protein
MIFRNHQLIKSKANVHACKEKHDEKVQTMNSINSKRRKYCIKLIRSVA